MKASGPELIGGISGESEGRIQDMFREAIENSPSVLFIDAIDVIAPKKEVRSVLNSESFKLMLQHHSGKSAWNGSTCGCSTLRLHRYGKNSW